MSTNQTNAKELPNTGMSKQKNQKKQTPVQEHPDELENKSIENLLFHIKNKELHTILLENIIEQQNVKLGEVIADNKRFISIIAHDLRSPLSSVLSALELIKMQIIKQEIPDAGHYISNAVVTTNRALKLLDSLMTWTVAQNTKRRFEPVKINLSELLMEEVEFFDALAGRKQIELYHLIPENIYVRGDIQMVNTIFRNLIGNAIKFTDTGGKITIYATENDPFIEISVKDNGMGISPEAQNDLFSTNLPLSTPGMNGEKGYGLGLMLCKEFIEMHGGELKLKSAINEGSTFSFTLPHYK